MTRSDTELQERLKGLHDQGLAEEKDGQIAGAAETFRQAVDLSRHEQNPLVELHCRWHYAMLLNELGRCRQGLRVLMPLMVEELPGAAGDEDYLCGGMNPSGLRIGAYFAFITAGLAAPLPRQTIASCLTRFHAELPLVTAEEEHEVYRAVYQLCNLEYLLRYRCYREALHAAQMTLAQLPDRLHGEFLCRAAEAHLGLDNVSAARTYLERFTATRDGSWNFSYARARVALEMREQNWESARLWTEQALARSHWEGRRNEKRQAAMQFTQVALASGNLEAGRQGLTELLRRRHSESRLERLELRLCLADWRQATKDLCSTNCRCPRHGNMQRTKRLAASLDGVSGTQLQEKIAQRRGDSV